MSLRAIVKQSLILVGTKQYGAGRLCLSTVYSLLFTFICIPPNGVAEIEPPAEPANIAYYLPHDIHIIKTVRVALLDDVQEAKLSFNSPIIVQTIETDDPIGSFHMKGKNRVIPTRTGFQLGKEQFKIYGALIRSAENEFTLNDIRYRGDLVIIREKDMTLLFINYVNLEDYLRGVLPKEVSPQWGLEALKAQAVVSRTYAVFSELSNIIADYSMEKTVASQLYGGMSIEHDATDKAVTDTQGEVLTYRGTIFPGYFHANCGGHTTRPDTVWHVKPHPLLHGVSCPYCKDTKHYQWSWGVSSDIIKKELIASGQSIGTIYNIRAKEKDDSGRITCFEIRSSKGTIDMKGNVFRLALDPEKLRSTKIENISKDDTSFIFVGQGWGHGVGLCQWGAKVMADRGMKYEEILRHYFPEAECINIY